jgi:uncharacterized protein YjbI with pentapeptide repeats
MANSEHVNIIKKGVEAWNKWREDNPDTIPDLAWANLIGMDLEGINLSRANMKLAFCRSGNFKNADFSEAILYGTNFQDSDLSSTVFQNADLEGANLINSVLVNADLEGANLKLAVLDRANCKGINLLNSKKLGFQQLLTVRDISGGKLETSIYEKLKESNPDIVTGK